MIKVSGVRLSVEPPSVAALEARLVGKFSLLVSVEPRRKEAKGRPIKVRILLPSTGRVRWPAEDVVALDPRGKPLPLTRDGIEWHRLELTLPPKGGSFILRAMPPSKGEPPIFPEKERIAREPLSGVEARICPWPERRRAALSLRFDDSHPTHLSVVIPELRRRGLKGTFMICPGLPDYIEHKAEWEAVAREGDQEFANHTLHHKGATGDDEVEREIGEAARYIRRLFPKMTLIALNLGGGTKWTTTKPMRYFLEKYRLFYVAGSLGMDDVYGRRLEALRRHLERHIERGLWCRVHFHSVGKGMASSLDTFQEALKVVEEHRNELWVAGMAEVYKYWRERLASRLRLLRAGPGRCELVLSCGTDPMVYDQPLTVELRLPSRWEGATVRARSGKPLPVRRFVEKGEVVLRFEARPSREAFFVIEGGRLR